MESFVLDHVAIAVASIAEALPLYERIAGAPGSPPERVDAQSVELVFVGQGPVRLELLQPTGPESPVGRFLEKRGPGIHHIAYRVPDIAAAVESLSAAGVRPISPELRAGAHGHRVLFLHPQSTGGVLIELIEG